MRGDPLPLNWLMVCDDVFTADSIMAQIQGFQPSQIPYLKWVLKRRPQDPPVFNTDWKQFRTVDFYLKRDWTDYPGLFAFRSRILAYLAYRSPSIPLAPPAALPLPGTILLKRRSLDSEPRP